MSQRQIECVVTAVAVQLMPKHLGKYLLLIGVRVGDRPDVEQNGLDRRCAQPVGESIDISDSNLAS